MLPENILNSSKWRKRDGARERENIEVTLAYKRGGLVRVFVAHAA